MEIARVAGGQHGLVTRGQLLAIGLDRNAIAYRLRIGRLHRIHGGVYSVGTEPRTFRALAMAAVLASGPAAVLSHSSAAALWRIRRWRGGPMEVTRGSARRMPGVTVHRARSLDACERRVLHGIPVTSPARTLLDLAAVLSAPELERAVDDARILRIVRLGEIEHLLNRSPGRGTRQLRQLVSRASAPTRSSLEQRFTSFLDRFGLPRPERNVLVAGHEVDALWRRHRLVVELDGRRYHESDGRFESDRARDADLLAAGLRVLRITWRRLADAPEAEARRLRRLLDPADRGG